MLFNVLDQREPLFDGACKKCDTRARARASRTLTRVSNRLVSRPGSARVRAHAPENRARARNNQQTTRRTTTTTSGRRWRRNNGTRPSHYTRSLDVNPAPERARLSWSSSLQGNFPSRTHAHAHALGEAREHREKGTVKISILYLAFLSSTRLLFVDFFFVYRARI